MIKEINGRWTCTDCGYEWSACMGDNEVPEICECQCQKDGNTGVIDDPCFYINYEE